MEASEMGDAVKRMRFAHEIGLSWALVLSVAAGAGSAAG
jgi:hypothetical protein